MLALAMLVLLAVLDLIATGVISKSAVTDSPLEYKWMLIFLWVNFLLVGGEIASVIIFLYKKWSDSEKNS